MVTPEKAHEIFLTIPVLEEESGTGHTGYRVKGKLFGTLWGGAGFSSLRVGKEEQAMLITDPRIFSVPQNGPKSGWITVKLAAIGEEAFQEVVWKAWRHTAPARLALEY
jgi:hypothetical protein